MSDERRVSGLSDFRLLGRSGLRVSPLCLGTMTFGTEWGWGSEEPAARAIFDRYLEAGGNFVDTADGYTGGRSEEMLGRFLRDSGARDSVVVATKFGFNQKPGDPNAGGNGRQNIHRALEGSLRRLGIDHVDLYWLHAWDGITPAEETMRALDDLVRAGKIRYVGLSNTPGWYTARAQTLAELRGWERVSALQFEYSLVERGIEREHVPLALELGMGMVPWSPLAGGLLSGKYRRTDAGGRGEGRLAQTQGSGNRSFEKFSDRNFAIAETLVAVAKEIDRSPAQVAIHWIAQRPSVVSTLIGATRLDQIEDNLHALEFDLPAELSARLEAASRPDSVYPYFFLEGRLLELVRGSGIRR